MPQFGYTSKREMDPKPGRKYSTTYHKQSPKERERTQKHIERTIQDLYDKASEMPDGLDVLAAPDLRFPKRESDGYYSPVEIVSDMLEQMESGKDIASGLLGRWNKLLKGTGREIELVPEKELRLNQPYNQLFGE